MAMQVSVSAEDLRKTWLAYQRWRKRTLLDRVEAYCRESGIPVMVLRFGSMTLTGALGSGGLDRVAKVRRRLKRTRWLRALAFARS